MNKPPQDPRVTIISNHPNDRSAPRPVAGEPEPRSPVQVVKDIALFFAAPFITIAYLVLFPFIGLRLLIRTGQQHRQYRNDAS